MMNTENVNEVMNGLEEVLGCSFLEEMVSQLKRTSKEELLELMEALRLINDYMEGTQLSQETAAVQ